MNLHYTFFGIGIPLLWLTVSWLLFITLYSSCYGLWIVVVGMQLQLHKNHRCFKVPASWTPRGAFLGCVGCRCLAVDQPLFGDCTVHLIYDVLALPTPQTADMLRIAWSIVTSSSLRGSPQCIAFKRSCTCRRLTAVQRNVCHVKGVLFFCVFVQQDL